jgi:hypothetical protein
MHWNIVPEKIRDALKNREQMIEFLSGLTSQDLARLGTKRELEFGGWADEAGKMPPAKTAEELSALFDSIEEMVADDSFLFEVHEQLLVAERHADVNDGELGQFLKRWECILRGAKRELKEADFVSFRDSLFCMQKSNSWTLRAPMRAAYFDCDIDVRQRLAQDIAEGLFPQFWLEAAEAEHVRRESEYGAGLFDECE